MFLNVIMLCLGSIIKGRNHVISELCYKGTILQRKMTILWLFSNNSMVNSMVKKMDSVISKSVCYKEAAMNNLSKF